LSEDAMRWEAKCAPGEETRARREREGERESEREREIGVPLDGR
jgi:hypothetical protein